MRGRMENVMNGLYFPLWNPAKGGSDNESASYDAVGRLVLAVTVIAATFGFLDVATRDAQPAVAVALAQDIKTGAR